MKHFVRFSISVLIGCRIALGGNGLNEPPVGVADTASTAYRTAVSIAVLANDTDADGDALQIKYFTQPLAIEGQVTQTGQNLVFTPVAGFSGTSRFFYRLLGAGAETAVTIQVSEPPPPETRVIAFAGGPADSASPGAKWKSFGIPSIYKNGEFVGFAAGVVTRTGESFSGVFSGLPTALQMRVRTGAAVPAKSGQPQAGVFFTHLGDPVFPQAPGQLFADQETKNLFAVPARIGGAGVTEANDTGLWTVPAPGQPFQLLAQEDELASGTTARFHAFSSVAMPMFSGLVFFTAKLRGPGVTAANDAGLWLWTPADGSRLILRTGSLVALPNGRSATLAWMRVLGSAEFAVGRGGYEAVFGELDAHLRFTDGSGAVALIALDGSIEKLVPTTQPLAPEGLVVRGFGLPAWRWRESGVSYPAVVAHLAHDVAGVTSANDMALLDRGTVRARKGERTGAGTSVFSSFADPVKGFDLARPLTLYRATLAGPGLDARNHTALLVADDTDSFTVPVSPGKVIARTGAPAPGGGTFSRLLAHTIVPGRGPAFTALLRLEGDTVTPATCMGLWATDTGGRVSRILRTGDAVPVGGEVKKLRRFDILSPVPTSSGQRRASTPNDPAARLIYRAVFTDHTTAILSTTVP